MPASSSRPSIPTWHRSDVIADFLKHAYAELHPTGVLLSLDVFGIMAWQRPVDLAHTGQDIVHMAKYCDVLSPMIYPSHFFGMDGIAHPGDAPEHFIGESMKRFELITKGSDVVIRPWLQAFRWRTKTYSPQVHRSPGEDRERHRRDRLPVLECRQRLQQALRRHAGDARGQRAVFPRG